MSALDDAETAYDLALLYHERGDMNSMARWMRVFTELVDDAGTIFQAPTVEPLRLVSGPFSLCVSRVFSARGFRKVKNGTPTTHGNRSRNHRK